MFYNAGRCTNQRSKQSYGKRKVPWQVQEEEGVVNVADVDISVEEHINTNNASINKINDISVEEINSITDNRIIDMTILSSVFILPCMPKVSCN